MENYLVHHGILGQKWGIRRYQNADGSLTAAGRERYGQMLDTLDKSSKAHTAYEKYEKKVQNYRTKSGFKKAKTNQDIYNFSVQLSKKDPEYKKMISKLNRLDNERERLNDEAYKGLENLYKEAGYEEGNKFIENYNKYKLSQVDSQKVNTGKKRSISILGRLMTMSIQKNQKKKIEKQKKREEQYRKQQEENARKKKEYDDAAYKRGYTKDYINYVGKQTGGFHQIDDPELLDLIEMEYEESTGKKARRR